MKAQVSLAWLEKQGEQKSVDAPQDLSAFKAQLKEYLLEEGWSKADPIYLDEAVAYKTESLLALISGTAIEGTTPMSKWPIATAALPKSIPMATRKRYSGCPKSWV